MSREDRAHLRLRASAMLLVVYLLTELAGALLLPGPVLPLDYFLTRILSLGGFVSIGILSAGTAFAGAISLLAVRSKPLPKAVKEPEPEVGEGDFLRPSDLPRLLDEKAKKFVEVLPLESGLFNVYAAISKEEGAEGYRYIVVEPELTPSESAQLTELKGLLVEELDVDLRSIGDPVKVEAYLNERAAKVAKEYSLSITPPTMKKFQYYLSRDFVRLGRVEPLMLDTRIEDISCDGPRIPIYIWHRDYESIPTNVAFQSDAELDSFVSKLAYVAGKHISIASPLVDASLKDGSRVHLSYGKEITQRGSTFTIRKFRPDPLTIVDLIKYNTVSAELAGYLWYLVEKRLSLLVGGGSAAGKTTVLNALSMFILPGQKVVSVEDTPELNLPQENWVQSVTRGVGTPSEITLFDLLRNALRQRPDEIIVGEVRGDEAYTLFQAISTGHGGLGTIHADSVEAVINRLTSEPMNLPKSLVGTTLDCVVMELKLRLGDRSVRRVVSVSEILGHDPRTDTIILNESFRWDPVTDRFHYTGRSRLYEKITQRYGTRPEEIRGDIESRRIFLEWLALRNIRSYKDVSAQVQEFYSNPYATTSRARIELEAGA